MEFIGTFITFLIIPTGATTGQRITINVGNDGAIKVYNSSGQLVSFIGGPAGAIVSYDPATTQSVALARGVIQWDDSTYPSHGGAIDWAFGDSAATNPAVLVLASGSNPTYDDNIFLDLFSGTSPGTQDTNPHVEIRDLLGTSIGTNIWVSGSILKAAKTGIGSDLTSYKWQFPTLGAGWASGSSTAGSAFEPIAYRLDAEDNLIITGTFNATSLTPAATVFTLPSPYIPPNSIRYPVSSFSSAGGLINSATGIMIANTGAVSVNNAVAILNGQNYCVHGTFPLYNIS